MPSEYVHIYIGERKLGPEGEPENPKFGRKRLVPVFLLDAVNRQVHARQTMRAYYTNGHLFL